MANELTGLLPELLFYGFGLVVQTVFFGVYSVLIVLSTRMLLKRGMKTRINRLMFIITLFMYTLSAAYWAYQVAFVAERMKNFGGIALHPADFQPTNTLAKWSLLFNAAVLVNYVFSDAVVVWRAWIISWRQYRRYLGVTLFFWVITCRAIIDLVVVPNSATQHSSYLVKEVDVLQMTNIVMSLMSNLSATAVVGATALRHRQTLHAAFAVNKRSTKAERILSLLVESGVLYCFSGLTVLICSLIRLPAGTLGDIYTPINIQIAGAYPPVVLLLVGLEKSLNDSTFFNSGDGLPPSRPIQFRSPHVGGSEDQSRAATVSIHFARNPVLSGSAQEERTDADVV
ncbi:hypothetical protein GGX14DRAFT_437925 [Mycena pura]|uniref:Uncharacterized protein n=1 Tax=Mycena pura TaxID=153505 RepID=A0AAD6VNN4_9AGAR|nr:hypothetical protein GGX14DRAFT_437925 [Mycena pura]